MDHILSELPTITCPSCLAHHGMVHSFIELFKTLHHKAVIHEGVKISYFCDFNGFGSDVKTIWEIPSKLTIQIHEFIFGGSKINADDDCSHEIKRQLLLGRKAMTNLDSILKSRDITLPRKVCLVKAMVFSSSHVWMWELDYKENWALKNWCFWTVMLEKTLESRLDCSEIQPVIPEGNQFWMFFGRTEAEAETPILWPPDVKNWLLGKNPDAGKD